METNKSTPNYLWSILTMRCPRCRRGKMFTNSNAYKKLSLNHMLAMPQKCEKCRQRYDLENGFWFGTGYVSYALAVAITVSSFVACKILLGLSITDNNIWYWLIAHCIFLVLLQPWMMRISRVIYLYFFVGYDANYENTEPKEFD